MINSIKGNSTIKQNYESKSKQNIKGSETTPEKEKDAVVLELGSKQYESKTYRSSGAKAVDVNEINRLWEQSQRSYKGLRELVEKLLSKQGKKLQDLLEGKDVLLIDDKTRAAAAKAVSEDGEWGVKAVSERIVAFAKAVSGNDKSKLVELKASIEQGFKEAEKALGGVLPDISKKTYDEVMRLLDEWEQSE